MRLAKYIAFEGFDGSGKTTQIQLLRKFYEKKGKDVEIVRQPGYTKVGELIRRQVLHEKTNFIETDLLLFFASHVQAMREISKRKNEDMIFILDRTIVSTICYQGFDLEDYLSIEELILLYTRLVHYFEIDHLFYLDIDPTVAYSRINKDDKFENRGPGYLNKLRTKYLAVLDSDQLGIYKKHTVIQTEKETKIKEIHKCIQRILKEEKLIE